MQSSGARGEGDSQHERLRALDDGLALVGKDEVEGLLFPGSLSPALLRSEHRGEVGADYDDIPGTPQRIVVTDAYAAQAGTEHGGQADAKGTDERQLGGQFGVDRVDSGYRALVLPESC